MCVFSFILLGALLLCAPVGATEYASLSQEYTLNRDNDVSTVLDVQRRDCYDIITPLKKALDDVIRDIEHWSWGFNKYFWLSDLVTKENITCIFDKLPDDVNAAIMPPQQNSQEVLHTIECSLARMASVYKGSMYFWSSDYSLVYMALHSYVSASLARRRLMPLCRDWLYQSNQFLTISRAYSELTGTHACSLEEAHSGSVTSAIVSLLRQASRDSAECSFGNVANAEQLGYVVPSAVAAERSIADTPFGRIMRMSPLNVSCNDGSSVQDEVSMLPGSPTITAYRYQDSLDQTLGSLRSGGSCYGNTSASGVMKKFDNSIKVLRSGKEVNISVNAPVNDGNMLICGPEILIQSEKLPFPVDRVILEVDIQLNNGCFTHSCNDDKVIVMLRDEKRQYRFTKDSNAEVEGVLKYQDRFLSYNTSSKSITYKINSSKYTFHNDGMNAALTGPNDFSEVIDEDSIVLFSLNQTVPYLLPSEKLKAFLQGISIQELDLKPLSQEEGEQ